MANKFLGGENITTWSDDNKCYTSKSRKICVLVVMLLTIPCSGPVILNVGGKRHEVGGFTNIGLLHRQKYFVAQAKGQARGKGRLGH